MTARTAVLAAVLLVGLCGFVVAGGVASEDLTAELEVQDPIVGEETNHTVEKVLSDDSAGNSLNYVDVDYSGSEAPDLPDDTGSVVRAGLDTNDDGEIDQDANQTLENVELLDDGETIRFDFDGSIDTTQDPNDRVIIEYTNVVNPDDTGPHDVEVQVNDDQDTWAQTEYQLYEPLEVETFEFETVDRTADLRLNVTEDVDTIDVDLDGDRDITLTEDDFDHLGDGEYLAENVNEGDAGSYDATLEEASREDDGHVRDAADGENTATTLDPLVIVDGNTSDDSTRAGETVMDQRFTAEVEGLTNADGHEFVFEFPDGFDGDIEDPTITVDGDPAETTDLDETDNDVTGTFDLDDGDDLNDATVTLEADVTYPNERTVDVDGAVTDGGDGSQDDDTLATVDVLPPDAVVIVDGSITNDTVEPAETVDHDLTVSIEDLSRNDEAATFTAELPSEVASTATVTDVYATDDSVTVEESDPSISGDEVTVSLDTGEDPETVDTDVVVELADAEYESDDRGETFAFDAEVEDHGDGTSDSEDEVATVDVTDPGTVAIVDGEIDPEGTEPGTTVTDQNVTLHIDDLIRDGEPADVTLEFPDELTDEVTLTDVSATDATVSDAELEDGERVTFDLDVGDGGGTEDAAVDVTFDATYDETTAGETLGFDATVTDSDGESDASEPVVQFDVEERDTGITAFDLTADDDELTVSFASQTELSTFTVDLDGPDDRVLDEADFDETAAGDEYEYTATVTVDDGDYEATLTSAEDVYDNEVAGGESDTETVDTASTTTGSTTTSTTGTADECEPAADTELASEDPTVHRTSVCAKPDAEFTANYSHTDGAAERGVHVDAYEFTTADDTEFEFNVTVTDETDADGLAHTTGIEVAGEDLGEELDDGTLYVEVDAESVGDAPADDVTFLDGTNGSTDDVTHVATANDTHRFALAVDEPGTYTVGVPEGDVTISDTSLDEEELFVNETLTVEATLTNDGYAAADRTVGLYVGDQHVEDREVTLGAGESTTVAFEWSASSAGVFDVTVDDVTTGSVSVAERGEVAGVETDDSPSYLWLLLILLLLLPLLVVAKRIRDEDEE